jgi:hypothetical protein
MLRILFAVMVLTGFVAIAAVVDDLVSDEGCGGG